MPTFRVAVTFESDTQAPKTYRGEVEGAGVPSVISRAFRQAKEKFKGVRYDSLCIIVEKPITIKAGKPEVRSE